MKKTIKVGLYNPYLDVLGGGEKHILSIVDVLAGFGYKVDIFWKENLINKIKKRFAIKNIDSFSFIEIENIKNLLPYDYFFYVTDGSYFISLAKKNYVFAMVPNRSLYNLNLINRLKLLNYKFISNSPFTSKYLIKWGINPITIPPYIDEKLFELNVNSKKSIKEKIILTVGRFFPHLHSKNQEKIIETFIKLKSNPLFQDYKLILAGGLKKEDKEYFNSLKNRIKKNNNDQSIILKPNIDLVDLYKLYQSSSYFWHFTGVNINEEKNPEQVEHFGIAPLEAMAAKCLTFCHNSGGPKLILKNKINSVLFNNEEELIKNMIFYEKNNSLKEKIIENGEKLVKKNYNYQVFTEKISKLL